MVLFDELSSSLKPGREGGENSIISAIAKEITGKIMDKMEAMIKSCVSRGEFERFNQTTEFKNTNSQRDVSEL
jgi:hypothetical protein